MKFEEPQKDIVYRVLNGNDTFQEWELVWIDSLPLTLHLNFVQNAAWLDEADNPVGVEGLEFTQQPDWIVETRHGLGGYNRARRLMWKRVCDAQQ